MKQYAAMRQRRIARLFMSGELNRSHARPFRMDSVWRLALDLTLGQVTDYIGVPKGIRTPVTAVKGRCPGPLDDGDAEGLPPGGARKITRLTPGGQRTPREARRSHPPRSRRSAAGGPFLASELTQNL